MSDSMPCSDKKLLQARLDHASTTRCHRIWAETEGELTAAAILDDVVMGALGSLTAGSTAAPGWVMEKVGLGSSFAGDGGVEEEEEDDDDDDDKRGEDRVKVGSRRASECSTSLNRVVGDCCGLLGSGWTVATSSSATATDVPGLAVANRASASAASPPPLNRAASVPVPVSALKLTPEPETAEETDETLLLRLLRPLDINSTSDGRARSCGRRPNMHSLFQSSSVEKMFPFCLGTMVAAESPSRVSNAPGRFLWY